MKHAKSADPAPESSSAGSFLQGFSIEVMPRSAAKAGPLSAILPVGTRVYVAHIEGVSIDETVETAKRIRAEGFPVMPHVPARILPGRAALETWLGRYREEAGVDEALMIAGGISKPLGPFGSSMEVLETGLADRFGFRRIHVAGHPEGNADIDPAGSTACQDEALRWKQAFADRTDAEVEIATQFCFDPDAVLAWAARLRRIGIRLPVHVGVAGPARIGTLIRYAAMCGVGASLRVLKRRSRGAAALLEPHAPDRLIDSFAQAAKDGRAPNLRGVHLYPFGGIRATAEWAAAALAERGSGAAVGQGG